MMKRLRRFFRAREGAAAVEFALIAPMMIVVLLGTIEIVNMLEVNYRVENSTISIADVISRDTEVTDSEMNGLWTAVTPLMFPSNPTGMDMRVTSISIDSAGAGTVVWSAVCKLSSSGTCGGGSSYSVLAAGASVSASDLPSTNSPSSSLIRAEATYNYTPIVGLFSVDNQRNLSRNNGVIVLRHTAFRRSRLVDPIPHA